VFFFVPVVLFVVHLIASRCTTPSLADRYNVHSARKD